LVINELAQASWTKQKFADVVQHPHCVRAATGEEGRLRFHSVGDILKLPKAVKDEVVVSEEEKTEKKSHWLWSLGLLAATGLAGAAVVLMRGCWHSRMSWPVRVEECSYQVCLGCGIKRLFSERNFQAYGPYSYDLDRLIAWDREQRAKVLPKALPKTPAEKQRPAS